jgi:hypothetical protein
MNKSEVRNGRVLIHTNSKVSSILLAFSRSISIGYYPE